MSTKSRTAASFHKLPLGEPCLTSYLALVQRHSNRQVSRDAGNEDEEHVGGLGGASGSELTVLVSRALIYSGVVWSEQTGAPPRLGASSVQRRKKHPRHCGSLQGKNHVSGLYFYIYISWKLNYIYKIHFVEFD